MASQKNQAARDGRSDLWQKMRDVLLETLQYLEEPPKIYVDQREKMDWIIEECIMENSHNLQQVTECLEKYFLKSFDSIEVDAIRTKYVDYCAKLWHDESAKHLQAIKEKKTVSALQEVLISLCSVTDLTTIPDLLKNLHFYKLLLQHKQFINKHDETVMVKKFKGIVEEEIMVFSDCIELELLFLEKLVTFMRTFENIEDITKKLGFASFCRNLSFNEFYQNLAKLGQREDISELKQLTNELRYEEGLFLKKKFEEIIGDYLKPSQIEVKEMDNRMIIEVTGKNIILSRFLGPIQRKLREDSSIQEVRFVCDILFNDFDLGSEFWHGKNIVVFSNVIKVKRTVVWDVSGQGISKTYNSAAGTKDDGNGKNGEDGLAGESGGNVTILTDEIEHPELWEIISKGGKGGEGQSGGNGIKGQHGTGISSRDFHEKYPPCARFYNVKRRESVLKTVQSIKDTLSFVKCQWYKSKTLVVFTKTYNGSVFEKVSKDFGYFNNGNVFLNVMTREGYEVTFSFESGGILTNCQAFLIVKGARGTPGGRGGDYGLGGQGGQAGVITVKNLKNSGEDFPVCTIEANGGEGLRGQGGTYGAHGRNGWDMGYIDYSMSPSYPKYFGLDQKSAFNIKYNQSSSSETIFCPYKNSRSEVAVYAEFTSVPIEHVESKRFEEKNSHRLNTDREHHARAVKKKNIDEKTILDTYSERLTANSILNLRSEMNFTAALNQIKENQEQQEAETEELKTTHHSTYHKVYKVRKMQIKKKRPPIEEVPDVDTLISKLRKNSLDIDSWNKNLKEMEPNYSQMTDLFEIFNNIRQKPTGSFRNDSGIAPLKIKKIGQMLAAKYQLAALQIIDIERVETFSNINLKDLSRYLVEAKENNVVISHWNLGSLKQYLKKDNPELLKRIIEYWKDSANINNHDILNPCYKTYSHEEGGSLKQVKRYLDVESEFLKKKEKSLKIFYDAFENELLQARHLNIFKLWNASFENETAEGLTQLLYSDRSLCPLVIRFLNTRMQDVDWSLCHLDYDFKCVFSEYIQQNGLSSKTYREVLARIFDVNIRMYTEKADNKIIFRDSRNPFGHDVIHLVERDGELVEFQVNKKFASLGMKRKEMNNLYKTTLLDTQNFTRKSQFDAYFKIKGYFVPIAVNEADDFEVKKEILLSEDDVIEKIALLFQASKRKLLINRLKSIKTNTNERNILHYMLKRFQSVNVPIPINELFYLINSVLSGRLKKPEEEYIITWIVAAYPQCKWIEELIFIQSEDFLKEPLAETSKWKNYLSKINNKMLIMLGAKLDRPCTIKKEYFEDTLSLLGSVLGEAIALDELELSEWNYAIKDVFWTDKLSQLVRHWQPYELSRASYFFFTIENTYGKSLATQLLNVFSERRAGINPGIITMVLRYFGNEKWNLSESTIATLNKPDLGDGIAEMKEETRSIRQRNIDQLINLMKGNTNTTPRIKESLPQIAAAIRKLSSKSHQVNNRLLYEMTERDIGEWVSEIKGELKKRGAKLDIIRRQMLAVVKRGIILKKGIHLRDTQKLAILTMLTNKSNTLAQVSTGEGKSLIVLTMAIIKALCGEKVDIITSSSILAKRDAEENVDIYKLFGVRVSHNCSEKIEERRIAYSNNAVIYGDLANFQRDYLLDKFYSKNILGDRDFSSVIIDEVDSMLLDKGNNMLYLSRDMAFFDKLESVYLFIWQWISRPVKSLAELYLKLDTNLIKEAVISDLFGLLKQDDVRKLGSELTEGQINKLWKILIDLNIIDRQGKMMTEEVDFIALEQTLHSEFNAYVSRLKFLFMEIKTRQRFIHVPTHLKDFVYNHLERWINSAKVAFFLKPQEDYVVDVARNDICPDRHPIITIVDRDTGEDQANSQWDEGLHQFLQINHGCKISLQSLKTVFISNVSYFKLYKTLYGLTGTVGSERERNLLQEIHEVDFVTIPTARPMRFFEEDAIVLSDEKEWKKIIIDQTKQKLEEGRSVLIICETVDVVEKLRLEFSHHNQENVVTYIRDYEEFAEAKGTLSKGKIIIATNLAGRGTDIKLDDNLKRSKGLHVILTYLPRNMRIEQQAFGRAARSGDHGSGQIIIAYPNGAIPIYDLKRQRNLEELHRLSEIKVYYKTQIVEEERCFKRFHEQYQKIKDGLDNQSVPTVIKDSLLQSCRDKWTFWLDENSVYIKELSDTEKRKKFDDGLEKFISQLSCLDTKYNTSAVSEFQWLDWVKGNPAQQIKIGRHFAQHKELDMAIQMFDQAINEDPYFSEAAYYFKAFALAKRIDWSNKVIDKESIKCFKNTLRKCQSLIQKHIQFCVLSCALVANLKKGNQESIIENCGFEDQKKNIIDIYTMFSTSIDDLLGQSITPDSFTFSGCSFSSEVLYEELINNDILKKRRFRKEFFIEKMKNISVEYRIPERELLDFLNDCKGQEFDEERFPEKLKTRFNLESRTRFWELLIRNEMLVAELEFVKIDMKQVDQAMANLIIEKINTKELFEQNVEAGDGLIVFSSEWNSQENRRVFSKKDLIQILGTRYDYLEENAITENRSAFLDVNKVKNNFLPEYDSITMQDFLMRTIITEEEAQLIISNLVQHGILYEDHQNMCYRLQILNEDLLTAATIDFPLYKSVVNDLLHTCFLYRLFLLKISNDAEKHEFGTLLMDGLEHNLFEKLMEEDIIKNVKAIRKYDENVVENVCHGRGIEDKQTLKRIKTILKQSVCPFWSIDNPDCVLKSISQISVEGEFGSVQEWNLFSLNGLDHFIEFEEKKWSISTMAKTSAVACLGICEIWVGICQVATPWGAALLGEGINDIIFAGKSFKSGHFSSKNYAINKGISLAVSFALSYVLHLAMARLSWTIGVNVAEQFVGKKIIQELGENLGFKLLNIATPAIAQIASPETGIATTMQKLSNALGKNIAEVVEESVRSSAIFVTLETAYETFGDFLDKRLKEIVVSLYTRGGYEKCFLDIANAIVDAVLEGVTASSQSEEFTENFEQVLFQPCLVVPMEDLKNCTSEFLSDLGYKLNYEVQHFREDYGPEEGGDFSKFKKQLKANWHSEVQRLIDRYVTASIMKTAPKYIQKKVRSVMSSIKGGPCSSYLSNLKGEYELQYQGENENVPDKNIDLETENFNEYLRQLIAQTKNDGLLSVAIQEDIGLDITCFRLCFIVLVHVLGKLNLDIAFLTCYIEHDGVCKQYSSRLNIEKTGDIKLHLELENHFVFSKSKKTGKMLILYEALAEAIPEFKKQIGPNQFKTLVLNAVENEFKRTPQQKCVPESSSDVNEDSASQITSLISFGGKLERKYAAVTKLLIACAEFSKVPNAADPDHLESALFGKNNHPAEWHGTCAQGVFRFQPKTVNDLKKIDLKRSFTAEDAEVLRSVLWCVEYM